MYQLTNLREYWDKYAKENIDPATRRKSETTDLQRCFYTGALCMMILLSNLGDLAPNNSSFQDDSEFVEDSGEPVARRKIMRQRFGIRGNAVIDLLKGKKYQILAVRHYSGSTFALVTKAQVFLKDGSWVY